jgi:hypothetical protein
MIIGPENCKRFAIAANNPPIIKVHPKYFLNVVNKR